jgi:hypothetical protein
MGRFSFYDDKSTTWLSLAPTYCGAIDSIGMVVVDPKLQGIPDPFSLIVDALSLSLGKPAIVRTEKKKEDGDREEEDVAPIEQDLVSGHKRKAYS